MKMKWKNGRPLPMASTEKVLGRTAHVPSREKLDVVENVGALSATPAMFWVWTL